MEFETPADAWYVWLGVALASVAALGVATALPSTPPPDANAAANAIDRTAASPSGAAATYAHDAEEIRIDERRLAMRNDGGTVRASLAFDTVVHATGFDRLEAVVRGTDPAVTFADVAAFEAAVEDARSAANDWRVAGDEITVRRVHWGEFDVTLVVG